MIANADNNFSFNSFSNKASNNDYLVSIFDLQGKKVFSGNYKNIVSQEISIVDLVSGVYIMNVTNGSWNKNIRFVKQ